MKPYWSPGHFALDVTGSKVTGDLAAGQFLDSHHAVVADGWLL